MPRPFTTIGVRFEADDYDKLIRWQKSQDVIPSLSAAVRYLVVKGLEAELKKKESNG